MADLGFDDDDEPAWLKPPSRSSSSAVSSTSNPRTLTQPNTSTSRTSSSATNAADIRAKYQSVKHSPNPTTEDLEAPKDEEQGNRRTSYFKKDGGKNKNVNGRGKSASSLQTFCSVVNCILSVLMCITAVVAMSYVRSIDDTPIGKLSTRKQPTITHTFFF